MGRATRSPVRPEFSAAQGEAFAREILGVACSATELPSYIDRNFRIRHAAGDYVLKIAHDSTPRADMEFECLAMAALERAEVEIDAPRVVRADERSLYSVRGADGRAHVARLVSYVPGALLSTVERASDELFRDLGQKLAQVDHALAALDHPSRHRVLPWDIAHASWIAAHLDTIAEPERRALVDQAFLQFRARIVPALSDLPRSVIHNDANDNNLTIADDGQSIVGLFDFGDLVETARLFEPAIAATYAGFYRSDDPVEAITLVAAGYHSQLPFSDLELSLFRDAVCTRLAVSVVSAARARASDPENSYAAASETQAWDLLAVLSAVDAGAFLSRLRRACGLTTASAPRRDTADLIAARRRSLGPSLSTAYERPLELVRGRGQYLFDPQDRAYLDCVNNVCHVGHSHPRVVEAASRQMALLNTNTRYLHPKILEYAERLTALMPEPLEVCFLVCSGSEANELALRLARTYTGRRAVAVLDHAYHGNTSSLVDLSPYKFAGAGGYPCPDWVHVMKAPDPYRDARGVDGQEFARQTIGQFLNSGPKVAALFAESLLGCGGQIVPPPGYLTQAFELVRASGAVAIADEVQVGFGRVGSHMWAFEAQGALPDIVTLGKPIGNGHPIGAVVTTRPIAEAFANGMEYFNTFGGNPVSCVVGLSVLDVIEDEHLQAHAAETGAVLRTSFEALARRHPLIGDVRGAGLFLGVELVRDRDTREPAPREADAVVQHCRGEGILLSTDGPHHNVLKVKPPMPFDAIDAQLLVATVDRALSALVG